MADNINEPKPKVVQTLADGVFPGSSSKAPEDAGTVSALPVEAPPLGDTVGTGTAVALGCIGGTIFLIVIALLILLVSRLIG